MHRLLKRLMDLTLVRDNFSDFIYVRVFSRTYKHEFSHLDIPIHVIISKRVHLHYVQHLAIQGCYFVAVEKFGDSVIQRFDKILVIVEALNSPQWVASVQHIADLSICFPELIPGQPIVFWSLNQVPTEVDSMIDRQLVLGFADFLRVVNLNERDRVAFRIHTFDCFQDFGCVPFSVHYFGKLVAVRYHTSHRYVLKNHPYLQGN